MPGKFAIALLACLLPVAAQQRTTLDGVYSGAQADRGEALYEKRCARCHEGADVDGPALQGTPFVDRWREDRLEGLFAFLRTNMPQDDAGKLKAEEYLDITAHILRANGYKNGAADLTEAALGSIILVGKDGPKPLPGNTLVETEGCLAKAGTGWTLAAAADLRRTRSADQITTADKSATRAGKAGSYQLRNLEDANTQEGKAGPAEGSRALVKGALVRGTGGDRINVLAWEPIGKCQ